nr:MAG TPA: hypothetical protein [Caudoviricetes sp.]
MGIKLWWTQRRELGMWARTCGLIYIMWAVCFRHQ